VRRPRILSSLVLTLVAIGAVLFFFFGITRRYDVSDAAMEPTLHCAKPARGCEGSSKDQLLVVHMFYSPGRGDLVALSGPIGQGGCAVAHTAIRRLIGLPGDTVSEQEGRFSVNGRELTESYVEHRDRGTGTWHVPPGRYFVLGDNRSDSCDSRQWGTVTRSQIAGEVVLVYWPLRRIEIP
jgi:signal peptidase I